MSKITFEFDGENIDDMNDVKLLMNAAGVRGVLFELTHNLKKKIGYKLEEEEFDSYDALELCFEEIHNLLDEHDISDNLFL